MNVPAVVLTRLAQAKITEAAIIDDVFEGAAELDIQPLVVGFSERVEDDDDAADELLKNYNFAPGGRVDVDLARSLWDDRDKLGAALRTHANYLLSEYAQRREGLEKIKSHLESLNLHVTCYGNAADDPAKLPPESIRFILLDYSLTPDEHRPRNAASVWCA